MKKEQKKYIIGTRASLLAVTQCNQIKEELEEKTGQAFELKLIKTEGDLKTEKPLWQMDGKDFFTKELDQALVSGEVDLVVHSYKDLGSDRPSDIELAAITKRHFSQDILLIKKETIKKLDSLEEFIVGTSSPRRIINTESKLADFLPTSKPIKVKTSMLRGNVNTRIQKLLDGNYHAIILAFPGIERLAQEGESRETLKKLLKDLSFMILPLTVFPTAASQGALALECKKGRNDQGELLSLLKSVEDEQTALEIEKERRDFAKYGGGCHLAVGIQVEKVNGHYLTIHQGAHQEKMIERLSLEDSSRPERKIEKAFIGFPKERHSTDNSFIYDSLIEKNELQVERPNTSHHTYMASSYGIDQVEKLLCKEAGLWAAGPSTMKKMATKGHWAHGSADGLGEERLLKLIRSKTVELMTSPKAPIAVYTNEESSSTLGHVHPIYKRNIMNPEESYENELKQCEAFFWTSFKQYQLFTERYPFIKNKFQATGPGKSLKQFREKGIEISPFASSQEFKNWIRN